jgi:putative salt-induced outer membrane protein
MNTACLFFSPTAASFVAMASLAALSLTTARALGDEPAGAPPPEAKALVEAPKPVADAPKIDAGAPNTEINATASAGGQLSTGNSQQLAGTMNGKFEFRRSMDEFGASLLGNYAQGAPGGQEQKLTTENVQGRVRYDRFVADKAGLFAIATGRSDKFEGLDFRLNLDPGFKYLFVKEDATAFWAELGYDFQFDVRNNEARVQLDASGQPVALLPKRATDHSVRAFVGLRHALNKEVTLTTGLEFLQSLVDTTKYRVNYDALFAANIVGGFALGVGFSLRYDHDPLPGKMNTDTATTLNLIYAYSSHTP